MQKLIIFLLALILVGCGSHKMPPEHFQQPVVRFDPYQVWPLNLEGSYLQKVTATFQGKKYSFTIHLTLEDELVEAIAMSNLIGRIYHLKWTPNHTEWDKSSYLPDFIKPEDIITDFLFVHLPADRLQRSMGGPKVFERDGIRVIHHGDVLRKITYEKPIGKMWGHIVIEHPALGYQLDIQTVAQ